MTTTTIHEGLKNTPNCACCRSRIPYFRYVPVFFELAIGRVCEECAKNMKFAGYYLESASLGPQEDFDREEAP
jgi:predicted amidophosphoribosyltransferase